MTPRLPALLGAPLLLAAGCAPAPASAPDVEVGGHRPARAESLRAAGWRTDLGRRTVPLDELRIGPLTPEDFPPIDAPRFAPAADCALDPAEPVLVHRGEEGVRAWPLVHLLRRELVLDRVDDVPVAVTFCTLCGGARAWDRRLDDGRVLDLGVSGLLHGGNALLYDEGTHSLWRQLDGVAVVGEHAGRRLRAVPTFTASFGALRGAHPDATVLRAPAPAGASRHALLSAEDVARGEPPAWLDVGGSAPLAPRLRVEKGADVVVLHDPRTASAYRAAGGGVGPAVGSSAAFVAAVDGRRLTFDVDAGGAVDRETGSRWNVLGEAVAGPLRGRALEPARQVRALGFALDDG